MNVMLLRPSLRSPSSGPSDHLLPAGEKRERAATSRHHRKFSGRRIAAAGDQNVQHRRDHSSPAGRWWRVAPDEGAANAAQAHTPHWAGKFARERVNPTIKNTTRGETT